MNEEARDLNRMATKASFSTITFFLCFIMLREDMKRNIKKYKNLYNLPLFISTV